MRRFLITGGAGFIGSNLAEGILRRGDYIRVIDNLSSGKKENLQGLDIDFIEGDIRDIQVVEEAVADIDYVLHHAAVSSVKLSVENPYHVTDVNIMGSLRLLEASQRAGVKAFFFASSAAVYGDSPGQPKKETDREKPLSPYAVSKKSVEDLCYHYFRYKGLPTRVFRYFNIFGPKQDPKSEYSAVIPRFIDKAIKGENPIVYGDGLQTRDFLYVGNILDAVYASLDYDGFFLSNLASGRSINLLELIAILSQISGKSLAPNFMEQRPADIRHSSASIDRARDKLDWIPRILMEQGLKETFSYYEKVLNE